MTAAAALSERREVQPSMEKVPLASTSSLGAGDTNHEKNPEWRTK